MFYLVSLFLQILMSSTTSKEVVRPWRLSSILTATTSPSCLLAFRTGEAWNCTRCSLQKVSIKSFLQKNKLTDDVERFKIKNDHEALNTAENDRRLRIRYSCSRKAWRVLDFRTRHSRENKICLSGAFLCLPARIQATETLSWPSPNSLI